MDDGMKNYRVYSNYLRHHGVKGMKWGKRKSDDEIAEDVLSGKYGNGEERRAALEKAGYKYDDIQKIVNEKVSGKSTKDDDKEDKDTKKSSKKGKKSKKEKVSKIVDQVINGKYGNGQKRVSELTKAGYDYDKIQRLVNKKLLGKAYKPRLSAHKSKSTKSTKSTTNKTSTKKS